MWVLLLLVAFWAIVFLVRRNQWETAQLPNNQEYNCPKSDQQKQHPSWRIQHPKALQNNQVGHHQQEIPQCFMQVLKDASPPCHTVVIAVQTPVGARITWSTFRPSQQTSDDLQDGASDDDPAKPSMKMSGRTLPSVEHCYCQSNSQEHGCCGL